MQMKVFRYGKICLATRRALYKHIFMNRNGCILCIHIIKYVYIYMSVYVTSLCRVYPCCCLCRFCVRVRLGATAWVKEEGFTERTQWVYCFTKTHSFRATNGPTKNTWNWIFLKSLERASRNRRKHIIGGVVPLPGKSDHQDYCTSSFENPNRFTETWMPPKNWPLGGTPQSQYP